MNRSDSEGLRPACGIVSRSRDRATVAQRTNDALRVSRADLSAASSSTCGLLRFGGRPADYRVAPGGICISSPVDRLADELAEVEKRVEIVETESGHAATHVRDRLADVGSALIDARFEPGDPPAEQIAELASTIEALNLELSELRRSSEQDRRELKRLRARVSLLDEALAAAKKRVAIERRDVDRLESLVSELESSMAEARERLSDAGNAEVQRLRAQAHDFQLVISDLRKRMVAQNREVEQLRIGNDLLKAELSDTRALLRATHKELVSVCDELRETQKQVDEAERFAWDAERRADDAINRATAAEDRAFLAEQHAGGAEAETELMEAWMNKALARVATLEDELCRIPHLKVVA